MVLPDRGKVFRPPGIWNLKTEYLQLRLVRGRIVGRKKEDQRVVCAAVGETELQPCPSGGL